MLKISVDHLGGNSRLSSMLVHSERRQVAIIYLGNQKQKLSLSSSTEHAE